MRAASRSLGWSALFLGVFVVGCSSPSASGEPADSSVAMDANEDAPAWVDGKDERCFSEAYTPTDDCERCQNENCCNEYFACYDDHMCYMADYAFDVCQDEKADAGGGDAWGGDAGPDCWALFIENSGDRGTALNACINTFCPTRCHL